MFQIIKLTNGNVKTKNATTFSFLSDYYLENQPFYNIFATEKITYNR